MWITFSRFQNFRQNRIMNLETIFEDLETQFEVEQNSQKNSALSASRIATTVGGIRIAIDRPIFGDTFVAGVLAGKAIWRFQPHRSMAVFKLKLSDEPGAAPIVAEDLLNESLRGRFVRFNLTNDGQQVRKARVLGVDSGLILFEPEAEPTGVPIDRLAWLEVHAGDN